MRTQRWRQSCWSVVQSVLVAAACLAEEKTPISGASPAAATVDSHLPASAFSLLKQTHAKTGSTMVPMSELNCLIDKDGGGACASAAGINVLQALRVMCGESPLANPHQAVLASFADQKELLKGRVSNDQFSRLVSFYQAYLGDAKVNVAVESAPNSSYATDNRRWAATTGPDLRVAPREIKIISYTVTKANGDVPGRHFVLLQEQKQNEVVVIDPMKPTGERRYILEYRAGDKGDFDRLFLLQPAGAPVRSDIFELNTVFRVTAVETEAAVGPKPAGTVSIESVQQKIDQTASELRGTGPGLLPTFLSPRIWREKTASFGLPSLDLPVELGGANWTTTTMLEVFRHAGRYNLNFRDVVGGAHGRLLLHSKHPTVLNIVREVAAGKAYIAVAMTEPDAGSDFNSIKTFATKVDGGYRITGEKRYVARLEQATHLVLFTRATSGKERELSAFVLPMATEGLMHVPLEAHGLVGNSFGGIKLDNVFVPDSHLLGEDGKGTDIFVNHFRYWRLMQVATALGTAEDALRQMAERLKTREAYGAPIGRFTHLQQALGQHATELRMALSLAREAAALVDQKDYREADKNISGLKAEGIEISLNAVDAAVRSFGGEGYSNRVDLGDRLRDLNGLRIADGTTDVMRMDVVRRTYGQELWDMAVRARE